MMAGDIQRIGWTYPSPSTPRYHNLKKIKPFCEIYEKEIVFYALQRNIPFQTEDCPYMDESIRTQIREFINTLETRRPGIKYNLYNSILKISKNLRDIPTDISPQRCKECGHASTSRICSVCKTILILQKDHL
jgi:cytoplasmic tRNA 2-thiolation protein 1